MNRNPSNTVPVPWRRGLAFVSLGVNVVLLLWLARPWAQSRMGRTTDRGRAEPEARAVAPSGKSATPEVHSRPRVVPGTPWSRLASTNLLVFAARLREAGCPEATVCDIVTPRIERLFDGLREEVAHRGDYWAVGEERRGLQQATLAERERLDRTEEEWMATLGCPMPNRELDADGELQMMIELVGGGMGPVRLRQLLELSGHESRRVESWKRRTEGVVLPEELEEIRRDRSRFEAELLGRYRPEELEEIQMRLWVIMNDDEYSAAVSSLGLTPGDAREFCRILASGERPVIEELARYRELEGTPDSRASSAEVDRRLRSFLGDERFLQFRQETDGSYREVVKLSGEYGQDPSRAREAFGQVESFREAVAEFRRQWAEDPRTALQGLRDRREELRAQLQVQMAFLPDDQRENLISNWVDSATREGWRAP